MLIHGAMRKRHACARRLYKVSLPGNAAQHTHSALVLVTAISMHALLDPAYKAS